jgi:TonB family protein
LAFSFSLSEPERKLDIRVGPQAQRFAKFVLQKPKPAEPPPEEDPRVKRLPSEGPHGPGQGRDPRAPRDQRTLAIERVERRGLLTFFRPGAGGADSLFTHDVGERLDQAMTGLSANAGSGGGGGLGGGRGSGLVGQGGGFGSVYGTDVETRGSGSPRSSLSGRREHAVRTQVTPGAPSIDGFLSREQIDRVVRAHQRGIQYCYETELQRLPRLSGKVVVRFRIDLEGKVIKVDIDSSTLANAAVEGCVLRQIRRWQFPAPEGGHCIVAYPFLFSTGM